MQEIAVQLGAEHQAVCNLIARAKHKLYVNTDVGLVVSALKIGWLHLDAIQVQHVDRRG
jgi:DNA-binding CsgD family transcriptional regulator